MSDSTDEQHTRGLAVFAHELREPLASTLLAAQLMHESPCREPTCREMCAVVERQGRFLARMIDDTLEVCRGNVDKLRLQKDWFDLNAILADALESTRPLFARRGHRLTVSLPEPRVYVLADAARVQQVAINLLANAAKYTDPGGTITFDAAVTPDLIVIRVGDNGIGISPACLSHVFEMFRQVAPSRHDDSGGLGIGLALVRALVELHGGTVQAHSDGEGLGSVFSVRLPGPTSRVHGGPNPSVCQRAEESFMGDA